jgi:hypothetical protein
MSGFLFNYPVNNTPSVVGLNCGANLDTSLQSPDYNDKEPYTSIFAMQEVDILWKRSHFSNLGSDPADKVNCLNFFWQYWEWCWPPTGCHVPKKVSGIVRDSNGNPVAGATVQLFNTATGTLVDTQTSLSDGSYTCGDPNAVASFAVGYLPDAPDTAGTTVDTLTGT